MNNKAISMLCLGVVLLVRVNAVSAMQEAAHEHRHTVSGPSSPATETRQAAAETSHEMTAAPSDHAAMVQPGPDDLRDPHAYSNGYGLTTGPYALASQRQTVLADGKIFAGLWMDRLEFVELNGDDAAAIEGYGWVGNSYNRILLQTEAEIIEDSVEEAEVDLLVSRAVTRFWDLRFGIRRELAADTYRNWATIGVNGLAPYWFDVDAYLYLGENGRTALDLEVEYDLLLTQRLVLQPRLDISVFGQADRAMGRGQGLAETITGARLRYEFNRQFAPYIGIERASTFGETADLLPAGTDRHETRWIMGLRFWF